VKPDYLVDGDGNRMNLDEAQARLQLTLERVGRIILGVRGVPQIGELRDFAGLPFRVIRLVSFEEAQRYSNKLADLWGEGELDPEQTYFEVVVAD